VIVRGSVLVDGSDSSVVVLMEEARRPELAPLIADTHGLTDGERRVTELVAKGLSTNEIGQRLHLSGYTVQDHLKSIFDKTGAGSRGELVACLFFEHYEASTNRNRTGLKVLRDNAIRETGTRVSVGSGPARRPRILGWNRRRRAVDAEKRPSTRCVVG
jgi:DNA-binding CsgD family transcriptional regulator